MSTDIDANREALEARADFLLTRLGDTIDAIAQRGRKLVDPRAAIARVTRPLIITGAVLGTILVAGAIASIVTARRHARRIPQERVAALVRLWKHPDRIAVQHRPPMLLEIGRNILVGAATFFTMQFVRRAGSRALPARAG